MPEEEELANSSYPLIPKNLLTFDKEKRVYITIVAPLLSRSVARPRGHRAKKAMVYTIFLGKQGKMVYTILRL